MRRRSFHRARQQRRRRPGHQASIRFSGTPSIRRSYKASRGTETTSCRIIPPNSKYARSAIDSPHFESEPLPRFQRFIFFSIQDNLDNLLIKSKFSGEKVAHARQVRAKRAAVQVLRNVDGLEAAAVRAKAAIERRRFIRTARDYNARK